MVSKSMNGGSLECDFIILLKMYINRGPGFCRNDSQKRQCEEEFCDPPNLKRATNNFPLIWLPYFSRVKKYTLNVNKECVVVIVVVVVYLFWIVLRPSGLFSGLSFI